MSDGLRELTYSGRDGWPLHAEMSESGGETQTVVVLLHGGGPDHRMFLPLAQRLADLCTVVLPDVRGYGRSVCTDPERHTWTQYAEDVIALLNHLGVEHAIVGGAGLGSTIALRTAAAYPARVEAAILISVEDIEDDERKKAEIEFMDAFAQRVRNEGIEAGWAPILPDLAPVIGELVREAIPRSDPASIAAAAAIGHDRAFRSVDEVDGFSAPTLIVPGMDARHPRALAEALARVLPAGTIADVMMTDELRDAEDFGRVFAPALRDFISEIATRRA